MFTRFFVMQKKKVFHGIPKIQEMRRDLPRRVKGTRRRRSGCYSPQLSQNSQPHLLLYFQYSMQNFTLYNTKPCFFSFLFPMGPVCSCNVVSIHFIALYDLPPTPSSKKQFIAFMCVAFTTILVFLLPYCLL